MLRTARSLKDFKIHASDGDLGKVEEFLFDDRHWVVRYLGVKTGSWLSRKEVLLTPLSIREVNWEDRSVEVSLTRDQVERSPPIESDLPVSRQKEVEYFDYYRLPYYWTGSGVFGIGPSALPLPNPSMYEIRQKEPQEPIGDPHLRSSAEIRGYRVMVEGHERGRVDDLVVDDRDWTVRYLLLEKGGLERGHSGLISPAWVREFDWSRQQVTLDLSHAQLDAAPQLESVERASRDFEDRLHRHFEREPYWNDERIGEIQEGVKEATWRSSMRRRKEAS